MRRRVLECGLVIAIVLISAQVFRPTETGSRHYFSPDSLKSKYRNDEWLLGLIPNYKSGFKSSALAEHLVKSGYWTPRSTTEPSWIATGYFSPQWKDGQTYLHRVLYWDDEKWIAWTEANPQLARFVWPKVLALLRQEESEREATELLLLAKHATSVEELRQFVQKSELSDELKKSIAATVE